MRSIGLIGAARRAASRHQVDLLGIPALACVAAIVAALRLARPDAPIGRLVAGDPGAVADLLVRLAFDGHGLGLAVVEQVDLVIARPDVVAAVAVELDLHRVGVVVVHDEGDLFGQSRPGQPGERANDESGAGECRDDLHMVSPWQSSAPTLACGAADAQQDCVARGLMIVERGDDALPPCEIVCAGDKVDGCSGTWWTLLFITHRRVDFVMWPVGLCRGKQDGLPTNGRETPAPHPAPKSSP